MCVTAGANLLVFTFPILFIAVLGCVYVHLGKKLNDYKMERCIYIYVFLFLPCFFLLPRSD